MGLHELDTTEQLNSNNSLYYCRVIVGGEHSLQGGLGGIKFLVSADKGFHLHSHPEGLARITKDLLKGKTSLEVSISRNQGITYLLLQGSCLIFQRFQLAVFNRKE